MFKRVSSRRLAAITASREQAEEGGRGEVMNVQARFAVQPPLTEQACLGAREVRNLKIEAPART